jgi:hypothetical protein
MKMIEMKRRMIERRKQLEKAIKQDQERECERKKKKKKGRRKDEDVFFFFFFFFSQTTDMD